MSPLNEAFREAIEENAVRINSYICDIIDFEAKMCPASEGVPCYACNKYVYQILLEVISKNENQ